VTHSLPEDLLQALRARAQSDAPSDFPPILRQRPAKALSARKIAKAEATLGFGIPTPIRDVYELVANGGFGPGHGLIGLVGGVLSDLTMDVVQDYQLRVQQDIDDPAYFWPRGVLPICHWGCAIYSCIDCRVPEATVIRFDPNPVDGDWGIAWGLESESFTLWLNRWAAGVELFESGTPDGSFTIDR